MPDLLISDKNEFIAVDIFQQFIDQNNDRIHVVAEKFGEYKVDVHQMGYDEARKAVVSWIKNFDTIGLCKYDLALRILEQTEFISSADINAKLTFDSKDLIKASNPYITHLGEISESSYRITADFNQQQNFKKDIKELLDAAPTRLPFTILFYDDFLNSGGQVITIFKALLNIPLGAHEIDDEWSARTRLNQEQIVKLKNAQIHIFYHTAFIEGIEKFEEQLKALSLNVKIHKHMVANNNDGAFGDENDQKKIMHGLIGRLKTKCAFMHEKFVDLTEFYNAITVIGEKLLRKNEPKWSEEKYIDRRLGYGNKCRLICTDHNFPSVSLTVLWQQAEILYNGKTIHWNNLLPRKKKELKNKLTDDIKTDIGEQLVQKIIIDSPNMQEIMISPIQLTIKAYLALSNPDKIQVAKNVGVYRDNFESMNPIARDREIMKQISERNLLKKLWESINSIKPFSEAVNPFN